MLSTNYHNERLRINPLTAGVAYIGFSFFISTLHVSKYHLLTM